MSGYFVHGGTQFPFGQNTSQQNTPSNQSYYGSTSYPTSQAVGQTSQYSSYTSTASDYGASPSSYSSNQYGAATSSTSVFGSGGGSNYSGNTSYNQSSNSNYSGNYGGGTAKTTNYNASSYNFDNNKNVTGNTNTNSYSSVQSTPSSYEKALYNAANQYYSSSARSRGNRSRGFGGRGRGRGGRGSFSQPQNTGPKPIKASEIKAYLYAWCGQRKLKPEYEVTTEGQPPKKVSFGCRLHINGLDYVAQVEASNKKDAQSKAAWDFCENLVKMGYMKAADLPPKPADPAPKTTTGETTQAVGSLPPETSETIDRNGGWTLTNARQRLNQFCQREHSTPIFKHTTLGPEHAKVFICDLSLNVNAMQKEFTSSERGSNKKQATAICALSMVRQLYEAKLIEKFGDPIKHVTRGGLLGGKVTKISESSATAGEDTSSTVASVSPAPGQKRKAEDQPAPESVDENGNWTVDNSRQRLNQFCQTHNIPCDVLYEEEGIPGNRTYTASLNLKVQPVDSKDETELSAVAKGQSKKVAAQGCALQLLSQLYKLTLVEANPGGGSHPNKKKQARPRSDSGNGLTPRLPPYADYGFMSFGSGGFNAGGFPYGRPHLIRRTPQQDMYLTEKHKSIYPGEHELAAVQRSVRTVEQALKEVSDQLIDTTTETPPVVKPDAEEDDAEASKKRKLQGVMRVGALAKGLLLKGDTNVQLVLLCQETPAAKLLVKVAQLLPKHIQAADGDVFSVETAMQEAAIHITNNIAASENDPAVTCTITVSLTSPVVRTPAEEAAKDPPGSLNKDKCLQALAELRHAKWFQACANIVPSCVIVIRVMREIKRRMKEWKPLSDWAIELLVEKSLATSPVPLSLGSSFLRCLECISSGILLPGGPGLSDPCERTECDVTSNLTNQERESLTEVTQKFERLFVYRQPYKVLGMEEMDWVHPGQKKDTAAPVALEEPKEMES